MREIAERESKALTIHKERERPERERRSPPRPHDPQRERPERERPERERPERDSEAHTTHKKREREPGERETKALTIHKERDPREREYARLAATMCSMAMSDCHSNMERSAFGIYVLDLFRCVYVSVSA